MRKWQTTDILRRSLSVTEYTRRTRKETGDERSKENKRGEEKMEEEESSSNSQYAGVTPRLAWATVHAESY